MSEPLLLRDGQKIWINYIEGDAVDPFKEITTLRAELEKLETSAQDLVQSRGRAVLRAEKSEARVAELTAPGTMSDALDAIENLAALVPHDTSCIRTRWHCDSPPGYCTDPAHDCNCTRPARIAEARGES